MTLTGRIQSNHSNSVYRQANKTTNCRAQKVDASSPSFVSRMIQFIFHRKRHITDQRSESWSGRPTATIACHQASGNITIPSGLSCSVPSAIRSSESTRVQRSQSQGDADSGCNKAQWRRATVALCQLRASFLHVPLIITWCCWSILLTGLQSKSRVHESVSGSDGCRDVGE